MDFHHDPNYRINYQSKESYVFPAGPSHNSPCMDSYWRSQPIRSGICRDEVEHDEKPDEEEKE